ncbi:hypothetical protein VFPPC_02542 [Pochonia chlamydosporia 170]|uniref:ubiquitinyl hydrolase 1 n=1 Tax=Pochonia chlamydosporia 170 TaxID=1380566 RepID=A0A179FY79_METCM|nr:hypothetical protein VFPPC_02542 [Pochonia chlamydosporia 170]OAQ70003.1 hypothetical protein VFPPC_02542 [Pochonia chlamydosporia 170]
MDVKDKTRLECIINHVILPRRLPNRPDKDPCDNALLNFLISSVSEYSSLCDSNEESRVISLKAALLALKHIRNEDGALAGNKLRTAFQQVISSEIPYLPLYVQAQNAGILVKCGSEKGEKVTFDIWGLTPNNNTVLSSRGRIVRQFPECAARVLKKVSNDCDFLDFFSQTLETMSWQGTENTTATKDRLVARMVNAAQDVPSPTAVTELLYIRLAMEGTPLNGGKILKHTREEVICASGSDVPWRRSPFWLFLRVVSQLSLKKPSDEKQSLFKKLMVFFIAQILDMACHYDCASDTIYCIFQKLCRRVLKLELSTFEPWMKTVTKALNNAQKAIDQCWKLTLENDKKVLCFGSVSPSLIHEATRFRMPDIDEFIAGINDRSHVTMGKGFRQLSHPQLFSSANSPPILSSDGPTEYRIFHVFVFEDWLDHFLDPWLEVHKMEESTCPTLKQLAVTYFRIAAKNYANNPMATSAMILRLLVLWVACDKAAVAMNPSLRLYKPPIPESIWDVLLLESKDQLNQLLKCEIYLKERQKGAKNQVSVFDSLWGYVPVNAFDNDISFHKQLRKLQNTSRGTVARQTRELNSLKDNFKDLMEQYTEGTCDEYCEEGSVSEFDEDEPTRSPSCARCQKKATARNLTIEIYESRLPAGGSELKTFVFELSPPISFVAWRDLTVFFLTDVLVKPCGGNGTQKRNETWLSEYAKHYCLINSAEKTSPSDSRVVLLSKTSISKEIRIKVHPDLEIGDVCVAHPHEWGYYDSLTGSEIGNFPPPTIAQRCTVKMPAFAASLQEFIDPSSERADAELANSATCDLHKCPDYMAQAEFKSLALCSLGSRARWTNILRQLANPTIDLNRQETALVLFESIHQAGSFSGSFLRDADECLNDAAFTQKLVTLVQEEVKRIQNNWEKFTALWILIMILARIASIGHSSARKRALHCLSDCRKVSRDWMAQMRRLARQQNDSLQIESFFQKAVHIALVCIQTFNMEKAQLLELLMSEETTVIFLECSIMIADRVESVHAGNQQQAMLLMSWKRIVYMGRKVITDQVTKTKCLDKAISRSWEKDKLNGKGGWEIEDGYWMKAARQTSVSVAEVEVQFNTLTAEILVNGSPSGKLPGYFEQHPDYGTFFGASRLEVNECTEPRMQYQLRHKFREHDVYLGLLKVEDTLEYDGDTEIEDWTGTDFLVIASSDTTRYDLVPERLLQSHLPRFFHLNHVHWLVKKLTGEIIEFSSKESPWERQCSNWELRRQDGYWQLCGRNNGVLVNPQSDIAIHFIAIFQPLANEDDVHVTHFPQNKQLEIRLPKLQLEFFVTDDSGKIFSRQYPGMVIDTCQDIGTLIGLQNKLVLRDKEGEERMVLVPEGELKVITGDLERKQHISISIDVAESGKVYAYELNRYLGKLQGQDFESNLFLVLLHAFTSNCLPDPFTEFTGTTRALEVLRSAEVQSSPVLSTRAHKMLQQIHNLGEKYKLSTSQLGAMRQCVSWVDGLGSLSHHQLFADLAQRLLFQCERYRLFEVKLSQNLQKLSKDRTEELCERSRLRNGSFYPEESVRATAPVSHDVHYGGHLDKVKLEFGDLTAEEGDGKRSSRFMNALVVSAAIQQGRKGQALSMVNPFRRIRKQSFVSTLMTVFKRHSERIYVSGPPKYVEAVCLDYNAEHLLKATSTFLPAKWFALCSTLVSKRKQLNRHKAAFFLETMAFSPHVGKALVHILVASLYMNPKDLPPQPQAKSFNLQRGTKPKKVDLRSRVSGGIYTFENCPYYCNKIQQGEGVAKLKEEYCELSTNCLETLTDVFLEQWAEKQQKRKAQWPKEHNKLKRIVNTSRMIPNVQEIFQDVSNNLALEDYFKQWHDTLHKSSQKGDIDFKDDWVGHPPTTSRNAHNNSKLECIFGEAIPPKILDGVDDFIPLKLNFPTQRNVQLASLLSTIRNKAATSYQTNYVEKLERSMSALESAGQCRIDSMSFTRIKPQLRLWRNNTQDKVEEILRGIRETIYCQSSAPSCDLEDFVAAARNSRLPRIGNWYLIKELATNPRLPRPWKERLVQFADCLTRLQTYDRLLRSTSGARGDIVKELECLEPRAWNPVSHPEWLVFEVEHNLRIRTIQSQFAEEMMRPKDDENSVMQLNMGEGKSSVIIPIIATKLASSKNLVRLIVTRSQSTQMTQIMTTRLGGLLGRRMYHLPVSRAIIVNEKTVNGMLNILQECKRKKGVLIALPEHVSALTLILADSSKNIGNSTKETLFAIKQIIDDDCRDIIDESDEIFSPKYDLAYPLGKEQPVDFARERCCIIPQVLLLAMQVSPSVSNLVSGGLIVTSLGKERFPQLTLASKRASDLLQYRVAQEICCKGLEGFPIHRLKKHATNTNLILDYITEQDPSKEAREFVDGGLHWTPQMRSCALLLRGLLTMNLLSAALKDRFRVNYGLDKTRQPRTDLAVPYRAKDTPSTSSEYSHPDVIIIKTCLAYYYNGLEDPDLFSTLRHLLQSDRADMEYALWVKSAPDLPEAWHDVKGISLEDADACKRQLFPHLKFLKIVADYYLSHIVFPKQLKEYSQKVSLSSWDIGRPKTLPTIGFSGTHDLEPLLPLPVKQQDHESQRHVDALVLSKMLASQNSTLPLGKPNDEGVSEGFLRQITSQQPALKVIIDVGAYLIDLTNLEVVRKWLLILREKQQAIEAAVYCDDNHELIVLDSRGKIEILRQSPFAKNMSRCVVFLDEAHSRGTDLRLPPAYRAAVTIGSNLTKDKLAQACMRMRRLGDGQFITYCIPHSIEHRIRLFTNQAAEYGLSAEAVISWTISQTWADMRGYMPIWGNQGRQYARQSDVWKRILEQEDIGLRRAYLNELKETDVQTVHQYQPRQANNVLASGSDNEVVAKIQQRIQEFQWTDFLYHNYSEEREQEVEVELETELEEERQPWRTKGTAPAKPSIHLDIKAFVMTGRPKVHSLGIISAFTSLADTTAARKFGDFKFESQLKVSKDFATVVNASLGAPGEKSDFYKRDVHHILTTADDSGIINNMILISPYEAEMLHDKIAKSKKVAMHIYAARHNRTYAPTDDLSLHVVPGSAAKRRIPLRLKIELNLFAGQLYFDSFQEYVDVCTYLGLAWNDSFTDANSDGFIPPKADSAESPNCLNAETSPIPFLHSFITNVRHYGGNIEKTHVGKMLSGTFLTEEDFPNRSKRRFEEDGDDNRVVKREKLDEDQVQGEGQTQNQDLGADVVVKREYDVEMEG